jgi:hypothetical protein
MTRGPYLPTSVSAQLVTWLGSLIGFMWLPTSALYGYSQFARYASGIFLILQLVLLVNFVYEVRLLRCVSN